MSLKVAWAWPDTPTAVAPRRVPRAHHHGLAARFVYAIERRIGLWSELTGVIRATGLASAFFALIAIATFPFVVESHDIAAALVLNTGLAAVAGVFLLLPTWALTLPLAHVAVIAVVVLETTYLGITDGLAGPYAGGFVPLIVAVALFASRRMIVATYGAVLVALAALALRDGLVTTADVAGVVTQGATVGVTALAVSLLATRQRRSLRRTEQRLLHQRSRSRAYRSQALIDPLTGLGNRRALERDLARADVERGSVTVVVADADGLKDLNDGRGHEAGDLFLRAIAELLGRLLRTGDRAYRVGGDEFVVLAAGGNEAAIARRIGTRLELDIAELGPLSASVGVASTADGRNAHEAVVLADRRMYEQKAAARR